MLVANLGPIRIKFGWPRLPVPTWEVANFVWVVEGKYLPQIWQKSNPEKIFAFCQN